jgi:DNA polymerase-3 subunit beta
MTVTISTVNTENASATVALDTRDLYTALVGIDRLLVRRPFNPVNPVIGGMLIESTGEQVVLSTFDYSTHVRYVAPVAGDAFRVLVDARSLLKVIRTHGRKLTDRTVLETSDGSTLTVRQGASSATLTLLPIEDMPARPPITSAYRTVEGPAFSAAVARVVTAAGRDDTLPALTGVLAHHPAGRLELAATDRFKLAVDQVATEGSDTTIPDVLWPAATLVKTLKAFGAKHGTVGLHADLGGYTARIGWSCGRWAVLTRAIDAEFPRYRKLIPTEATHVLRFDRDALLAVAVGAGKAHDITFTVDGSTAVVEYASGYDATSTTSITVERLEGMGAFRWAFTPSYLVDVLKLLASGPVTVSATTPTRPFVFRVDDQPDFLALVMPVRLAS